MKQSLDRVQQEHFLHRGKQVLYAWHPTIGRR
jgi:hypothetical protein